ncbi:MAG: 16S rRNA (cytosine(967)-C(5))-methyltransferase RsmB [Clostridia bacterium]|nr:16S rRNA (cytosine(967)-C(5))-methyltransferase RsmB [Clostridia bacterium]MBN2883395.1 16S rRNA (cytosine(967)-C(5))-methyltransferase RsmB [Clostridia bacterium]
MKPREAAFRIVYEVLYNDGYSTIALENIRNNHGFDSLDSSFITNIAMGTLRNSLYLDTVISSFSNIKLKKISPSVLTAIKIGTYQILFMDRVPDSAACNETVKLAGRFGGSGSRGFVNGILRNISRNKNDIGRVLEGLTGDSLLSAKYSFSPEAVREIRRFAGNEKTEAVLEGLNASPAMCIRNNTHENIEALMTAEGIEFEKGSFGQNAYYVDPGRDISDTDLYTKGMIAIQDEGAQEMVEFMNPIKGERILDACAAPGGKTAYIDFLTQGGPDIDAYDIDHDRITRMKESLDRLGANRVRAMIGDMSSALNNGVLYDAILLDVPCSGLGTSQRRPEIKLKYKNSDSLLVLQAAILDATVQSLGPGGRLVYGTCTLTCSENRAQVDRFIEDNPGFKLIKEKTILPDGKRGGFYMAELRNQND